MVHTALKITYTGGSPLTLLIQETSAEPRYQNCIWSLQMSLMCIPSGEPQISLVESKALSMLTRAVSSSCSTPHPSRMSKLLQYICLRNTELLVVSWKHHAFAHDVLFPGISLSPCTLGAFYSYFRTQPKSHHLSHTSLVTPMKINHTLL